MPIYLMSIRVLLSVELCVTLKTYLKGAPFYNAWKSRAFCGISKLGGKVCFWTFPPSVFSTAGHGPRFFKLHRRQVTQRRMRPDMIVVPLPVADLAPRVSQIQEPVLVQTLIPELAVEAFDVAILHRPARRDEVQLYSVLIRPPVQHLAGELRTVVDDHVLRFSSCCFRPSNTRTTRNPGSEVSTSISSASRVQPSIRFSVRNRPPLANASCVKSTVQTWSGSVGGANTSRAAAGARRRPRLRRMPNFSSTYSRYTRLWFTTHPSRTSSTCNLR